MPFKPSSPSSPSGPPFPPRPRPFGTRFQAPPSKDEHRINEQIRVPQVRLIDEKGGQVGVVPTFEALKMAKERGLDLMEVAAGVSPPVCKICDYGKFKYEKKKKDHQARKKQVVIKVKEVQFRPQTDEHDRQYKFRNVRDFLEEGDKAKITVMFRGREVAHTEPGYTILKTLIEFVKDIGIVESPPKMEGKKLIMVLAPDPAAKRPVKKPVEENKAESKPEKKTEKKAEKKESSSTKAADSSAQALKPAAG